MPQRLRQSIKFKNFNMPVSYRTNAQDRMRDARNVYTNQDRLETRNGIQRFNATALNTSNVNSITFFKKENGTKYYIAKCGTSLYSVSESGTSTAIKTGLTSTTKHRSVTFNNRAIISIENDGLFAWDGTTFSQLGQDPPAAPTAAQDEGAGTLSDADYKVALTYYSSQLGFETNIGTASNTVTTNGSNDAIDITGIPTTANNGFIDKVRIYLKNVTSAGEWIFSQEIVLGASTATITANLTSTQNPPETNAAPLAGGGKYLAVFGKKVVYSGNSNFPSDVFFSEAYLADAFDDSTSARIVLQASGQGAVTGLAVGYYTSDNLNPYLCIFKKGSVEVYSELGGQASVSVISSTSGAVSQDCVKEINGDIYFLSESGWHIISGGKIVKKKDKAFKLGDGDIDNIFTESGYVYELSKSNFSNFFSVYYPTLNQYLTFVSEGSNTAIKKAYNYEFEINGFRPYGFKLSLHDGCLAEDSNGEEIVLLAGDSGRVYKHSINVTRHDVDKDGNDEIIDTFAQLYWIAHDDYDATMNFGTLDFKALSSSDDITVKIFLNYELNDLTDKTYSFTADSTGFILDVSKLDEGVLGDGRTIVRATGGIYKTSQSLLIGFYQSILDANMGLIGGQLDCSKNGNPN